MRRRSFITLLGGAAAAWPLAARAQQRSLPVIGYLSVGTRESLGLPGFRQGLRETGFSEGQNVTIEYRWAENQNDRLPRLAAELVQRGVTLMVVAPNTTAIEAARGATATIPIVFLTGPDPVRMGLVASLNRPGGNLTGITVLSADLTAKRFGLLHDVIAGGHTIATLLDGRPGARELQDFNLRAAGRRIGVSVIGVWADNVDAFEPAFAAAVRDGANALLVSTSVFFIDNRDRLVALAAKYRLPTIYQVREYAAAGGLMSYGPNLPDSYRQMGLYAGRILKGEKPADLPVLLPTKFEFVINLQTAKVLGLTIPPGILAIADEVIE